MKKTLFVAISILLMLFAFTACEGNPSGPDDGEALVTEDEAKTLATSYFNAIDFSKLIVEASAGSTGTGLTVTDPASNGFTVEFKNYKGEALTANTEAKISAIESGSIKFTFSSPKSTVTANTYTAETVDPIVFADAEEGVALTFSITGAATISYETGMGGIAGLTPNTTVSLSKPAAKDVTISVGNVSVDFSDIEKDVTGGFGTKAEVPEEGTGGEPEVPSFTQDEAEDALFDIFNAIDKTALLTDINTAAQTPSGTTQDDTLSVTTAVMKGNDDITEVFQSIVSKMQGKPDISQANLTEDEMAFLMDLYYNPTNYSTVYTIKFTNYTNGFHDKEDKSISVTSGTLTYKIDYGKFGLPIGAVASESPIYGTYTVATVGNVTVVMNDTTYSVNVSDFSGVIKGPDIYAPNEKETPTMTIAKNSSDSVTVTWASIVEELKTEGTKVAEITAEQADANYFYQHFGTKRFLNSIYSVFTEETSPTTFTFKTDNIEIKDVTPESGVEVTAEGQKQFTLTVKLTDYEYYRGDSSQRVNGNVYITFYGTLNSEANTFTATEFSLTTTKGLNLSDSAEIRHNATVSFDNTTGTIGDDNATDNQSAAQGITFTVESNIIKGITDYSESYTQYCNEFVFDDGIENITITLGSN